MWYTARGFAFDFTIMYYYRSILVAVTCYNVSAQDIHERYAMFMLFPQDVCKSALEACFFSFDTGST